MKKLIPPRALTETLREAGYLYFSDEHCRVITLDYLVPLMSYKYFGIGDIWQYWIDKDCLFCENIGGMMVVFPLSKKFKN